MSDIIDNEVPDKDSINIDQIDQLFSKHYKLETVRAVSLKKSYINKMSATKSLQKLAVSLSDNSIEVYDISPSLSKICRLSGHSKAIGDIIFSSKEDNILYSAAEDGLLKMWDIRTSGSCIQEYKDDEDQTIRPYECLDISCNGRVLCAGSQLVQDDAFIVFWDQRVTQPLGGYWNSHTDDITQVKFHNTKSEILASGSADGLLNIFNITEQTEDDALTYSLNIENSVERLIWLDESSIACITQSNDLQMWNAETGDLLRSFSREKICRSIKRSKEDDCYLVDAFTSIDDTPVLLAGSYGGNGDCLRSVTITEKKLQPCTNFSENKQLVRCSWYDKDRDVLITGGESGIISVWTAGLQDNDSSATKKLTNKVNKLHVHRQKPY